MQRMQRECEDLRSKLTAAKEELVRIFQRREAEFAESCAALGNMREHQEYLMRMIDQKNEAIGALETTVKIQET